MRVRYVYKISNIKFLPSIRFDLCMVNASFLMNGRSRVLLMFASVFGGVSVLLFQSKTTHGNIEHFCHLLLNLLISVFNPLFYKSPWTKLLFISV